MIVPSLVLPPSALMLKASSMAVCCAEVKPPTTVEETELVTSVAVGRSVRSRSVNVIEPASVRVVPSVISPVTSTMAITGASLLPVMLMVTSSVSVAPASSVTVMVKTAVTVSPAARKSSSASVIV